MTQCFEHDEDFAFLVAWCVVEEADANRNYIDLAANEEAQRKLVELINDKYDEGFLRELLATATTFNNDDDDDDYYDAERVAQMQREWDAKRAANEEMELLQEAQQGGSGARVATTQLQVTHMRPFFEAIRAALTVPLARNEKNTLVLAASLNPIVKSFRSPQNMAAACNVDINEIEFDAFKSKSGTSKKKTSKKKPKKTISLTGKMKFCQRNIV